MTTPSRVVTALPCGLLLVLLIDRFTHALSNALVSPISLALDLVGAVPQDLLCTILVYYLCQHLHPPVAIALTASLVAVIMCDMLSFAMLRAPLTLDGLTTLLSMISVTLVNLNMLSVTALAIVLPCALGAPVAIPLATYPLISADFASSLQKASSSLKARVGVLLLVCCCFAINPIISTPHNPLVSLSVEVAQRRWAGHKGGASLVSEELQYLRYQEHDLALQLRQSRSSSIAGIADRPSVFLIMLESVRASALPMYNPQIPARLTPFLSSLVRGSSSSSGGGSGGGGDSGESSFLNGAVVSLVESLHTSMPNTMKSLFASLCGVPPHPSPLWSEYTSSYLDFCLPRVLRDLGWSTRFFTSSTVGFQTRLGFEQCLSGGSLMAKRAKSREQQDSANASTTRRYGKANFLGYDERVVLDPLARWLRSLKKGDIGSEQRRRQPAFAVIGSVTTHAPYTTANTTRARACQGVVGEAAKASFASASSSAAKSKARTDKYRQYLTAIHDTDDWLRDIFGVIDEQERGGSGYAIIIAGDHGEAFGERTGGGSFHGGSVYEEGTKVPLIFFDKRRAITAAAAATTTKAEQQQQQQQQQQRMSHAVRLIHGTWSSIDMRTTLLRLLGFDAPPLTRAMMPPASLPRSRDILEEAGVGVNENEEAPATCDVVISSLLDKDNMACVHGERRGMPYRLKLIKHGESVRFRTEVFNLTADPGEKKPLIVLNADDNNITSVSLGSPTRPPPTKLAHWHTQFAHLAMREGHKFRNLAARRIEASQHFDGDTDDESSTFDATQAHTATCFVAILRGKCPELRSQLGVKQGTYTHDPCAGGPAVKCKPEQSVKLCAARRQHWSEVCGAKVMVSAEVASSANEAWRIHLRRRFWAFLGVHRAIPLRLPWERRCTVLDRNQGRCGDGVQG